MAVIPRFDGRIGRNLDTATTAPSAGLYTPPARTSPLESFGQTVTQAATGIAQIYRAQQERVAADYTTKKSAEIQEFTIRGMQEAKQKALETGQVEGFTDNFLQNYDKVVNQSLTDAPNDLAREALGQRMDQARNSLLEQSMRFEAATKIDIYSHNLDVAADNYAKTAAMDPQQLPQIMKQLDGDLIAARKTLGMVDAEDRLTKYKQQIVATSMSQQINENPFAAQGLIDQYKGNLSAKDFVSLSHNAIRAQHAMEVRAKQAREEASAIASVFGAVNGGIPLDPTNKKSRKAFDTYYAAVKSQDPNADLTDAVINTNIMPSMMKTELSGKLANGDAMQQVQAARQLQILHDRAPNLVGGLTKQNKAKASLINSYIDAGVTPERAVEWATKETTRADEPTLKIREKAARTEDDLKFSSVESDFTGYFGGGVEAIPDEMRADYELLAKSYYVDSGVPADKAKANALNDIRAIWYKSNTIGRERYMKQAPEVVFKNAAGTEWMKEQFNQEFKSLFPEAATNDELDNIIIEPSKLLTRKGLPVYNVYKIDEETGVIDAIFDPKGNPYRFQPDFELSPTYKKMLDSYSGDTAEEKRQSYLREMEEQQIKQITRGQQPDVQVRDKKTKKINQEIIDDAIMESISGGRF